MIPLLSLVLVVATGADGHAGMITSAAGLEGRGSFNGTAQYSAANANQATLTVELWNTSLAANGGYLTAFVFHNPSDQITGATLVSTNSHFSILGGPSFQGDIAAPPFGNFDLGASTSGAFLGGGSPVGGIGVGESSTFTFALEGTGLDLLTWDSFFDTASAADGGSHGPVAMLARFRGFINGGSDKVPGGTIEEIPRDSPEPATLLLGAMATLAGLGSRWRRRVFGRAG
jgi:hypothetical protein